MNLIFKILFALPLVFTLWIIQASDEYPVGLTKNLPFATVLHQGKQVIIKRVQDTDNRLVDDFSRTSRLCPPFCIHPMLAAPGVETVGELELINFLENQVDSGIGLLVDARMPNFFKGETIPGAINIPFILFTGGSSDKVLKILGVTTSDDKKDFSKAKELCLFCNGPWCDQSPRAIKALIAAGYPKSKLKYYRGGMQLWKSFGLTTILPTNNSVKEEEKDNEQ